MPRLWKQTYIGKETNTYALYGKSLFTNINNASAVKSERTFRRVTEGSRNRLLLFRSALRGDRKPSTEP